MIIEIDGYQHFYEKDKEYDNERTEYFEKLGFYVLRFENTEVNKDIDDVRYIINNVCDALEKGVEIVSEYRERSEVVCINETLRFHDVRGLTSRTLHRPTS